MAKLTKTNFKTFIKKNHGKMFIKHLSHFDGMTDGIEHTESPAFVPVIHSEAHQYHAFGIQGAWLVGGGRDYFSPANEDGYTGIKVYNSCGSFIVATKHEGAPA